MKQKNFKSLYLLLGLLAGCSSVILPPSTTVVKPDAVHQDGTPLGGAPQNGLNPDGTPQLVTPPTPVMGEGITPDLSSRPIVSNNRAVIALLDKARLDTVSGQREAAGASLERALRIEPRNAWLWLELAQLRLTQGQYAQAVSLAQKSRSFSSGDHSLQALSWRVIGNARIAQGNPAGAEAAFKHAAELE